MSELICNRRLTGSISGQSNLQGVISARSSLQGTMSIHDSYDGEYLVTPHPVNQISLPTANKSLMYNIVVEPIPYRETINEYGGITVEIG